MAIEMLAAIFYTDVPTVEDTPLLFDMTVGLAIFVVYLGFIAWPYSSKVSRRSTARTWTGAALAALFIFVLTDRVLYPFLPLKLSGEDALGQILMFVVIAVVMLGSFVASCYLADPSTMARRNLGIATIVALVFALDIVAFGIELVAQRLTEMG